MNYLFDENNTRYTLVSTKGGAAVNWLFIPGGPGCDSSLLFSLTNLLKLPGNVWFIDLPGNGGNNIQGVDFNEWLEIFVPTLKKFENPVVVGHSFGAMLPLLYTECEDILKGYIILNSSPTLWLEAAAKHASENNLPDLTPQMTEFASNPSQETFEVALEACIPYYFPKHSMEQGRDALANIPFTYKPAVWWINKAVEINYDAKWIPQKIKTLIIGSEFDAITPYSLFDSDMRFNRENIEKVFIQDAGHLPWIEKPDEVVLVFENFVNSLDV